MNRYIFSIEKKGRKRLIRFLGIKIKYRVRLKRKTIIPGVTQRKRKTELIISLTSFPDRINKIYDCIETLLMQSLKADRVILYLAEEQFPGKEESICKDVLFLKNLGLEIRWCRDLKSYKKLIPALKEFPDAIIVTADDDFYYPENWLENLYLSYLKTPDCICGGNVRKVGFDKEKNVLPTDKWPNWAEENKPSFLNKILSGSGTLFPPHIFNDEIFNEKVFTSLCPYNDDLWFWCMAVICGVKVKKIDGGMTEYNYLPDIQEGYSISKVNLVDNYKVFNAELNNLLRKYPNFKENLLSENPFII
ncbi:MAG: glycosyltransferase family 2 protein [Alphaproteobacteria bacterium]